MNPEITQFYKISQSQLRTITIKKKRLMLNYVITILNIALITFIMIVNISFNYYRCQLGIII